jgi:16S rRNA (cytosine967-C5)-methyltransferase
MKPGARLCAAAEVLTDILERHVPAAEGLAQWGRTHRFAGSGDRAAIGNLVYDALRRRRSLAALMGSESARGLVIGAAHVAFGMSAAEIHAAADGSQHALSPLSEAEADALARPPDAALPDDVRGDYPDWLAPSLARAFGANAAQEGAALASRAPVDLRVNTLKADRDKVLKALERFGATPTPYSPWGVRIGPPQGEGRTPNVEAETGHGKGWFEVQDEGSQIAALLANAKPRQQVLDLCAGAGGKTLALAAAMQNTGQIYAYDGNRQRLRPIFERLKRAGARSVQVLEAGDEAALAALGPRFDVVLVDAPCSGSGVWRRRPDSKWRMRPTSFAERQAEQRAVLGLARAAVKPGGLIVYVTCSVLPEENVDIAAWLLGEAAELEVMPFGDLWRQALPGEPPESADGRSDSLQLMPARHGTDGFFVAAFRRRG